MPMHYRLVILMDFATEEVAHKAERTMDNMDLDAELPRMIDYSSAVDKYSFEFQWTECGRDNDTLELTFDEAVDQEAEAELAEVNDLIRSKYGSATDIDWRDTFTCWVIPK